MKFKEFTEKIKSIIEEMLSDDECVELCDVLKNNGVHLVGIVIRNKAVNISPTIYLERFYNMYLDGCDIEELAKEVIDTYKENCCREKVDVGFFSDFENIRDRVYVKLVNRDRNRDMLENTPHRDFLDLSLIPYCMVDDIAGQSASIRITDEHVRMWTVDGDEILDTGINNTRDKLGYTITDMSDIVEVPESAKNDIGYTGMYVMTNKTKLNGAVCMTFEEELFKFAKSADVGLYIIPSSIHEVIIIPAIYGEDMEFMNDMVRQVNATELSAEEVLADHAYYFDPEKGFA